MEIFNHQFEKLQVEYIDFYMFHGINKTVFDEKVLKYGLLDEMIKMKEEGRIRNLGFSFHGSYEDFEYILNYRDWDFCQIQYNYMDTDIQAGDRGVALAAERKVPLIIMEPVKGGSWPPLLRTRRKFLRTMRRRRAWPPGRYAGSRRIWALRSCSAVCPPRSRCAITSRPLTIMSR